jgi:hypothetical protein
MQGVGGLLNVVTIPPGATITSSRLVLDGLRGAIFVYKSGPAGSSLIGSWAGTAGTDPYGQAYPQGLNVAAGAITGVVFTGVNFILNSSGLFFYSGTPALGNLILSLAPSAGTDSFTNPYVQGFGAYLIVTGNTYVISMGNVSGSLGLLFQNLTSPVAGFPGYNIITLSNTAGSNVEVVSGNATGASESIITLQDSLSSSTVSGLIQLLSGKINFGTSGTMQWNDLVQSLGLPIGGGPFITNEGWHAIAGAAGLSGNFRVKLVPWLGVWFDGQGTLTLSASVQTFTMGALPSASYYPTATRHLPVALTGTVSSAANLPRLFIPTSGGPQLIVPTGTTAANVGWSCFYPTN